MIIKLSSSDRALLAFKDIQFEKEKDYSFSEASDIVESVKSAVISYEEQASQQQEELYAAYKKLYDKLLSLIQIQ